MADFDSVQPVLDDEVLYRRIPASTGWYQGDKVPPLDPEAFRPNRYDITGISLSRENHTPIEEAARGQPGKDYYVAVFRAGDLRCRNGSCRTARGGQPGTRGDLKFKVRQP